MVPKSSVSEDELSEAASTSLRGTLEERLRSAGGPPFRPFLTFCIAAKRK